MRFWKRISELEKELKWMNDEFSDQKDDISKIKRQLGCGNLAEQLEQLTVDLSTVKMELEALKKFTGIDDKETYFYAKPLAFHAARQREDFLMLLDYLKLTVHLDPPPTREIRPVEEVKD